MNGVRSSINMERDTEGLKHQQATRNKKHRESAQLLWNLFGSAKYTSAAYTAKLKKKMKVSKMVSVFILSSNRKSKTWRTWPHAETVDQAVS